MADWFETFDEENSFTIDVSKIIALLKEEKDVVIITNHTKQIIKCDTKENAKKKYEFIKNMIYGEKECNDFKDRSKFIELPCKVGDIFYGIDTYDINAYSCYGVGYGYVSANKIGFLLFAAGHREYIFGEEAFLTEAEAKQALKEREKE